MPKLSLAVPKYRRYRPKNLAVVNFGRGRDVYLGPWKSRRSRELYDQLVSLWLQHGRCLGDDVLASFCSWDPDVNVHVDLSAGKSPSTTPLPRPSDGLTLQELAAQYEAHAAMYYRKRGQSTREAEQIAEALAVAVALFGTEPAASFGPLRLQQVQEAMFSRGWSRQYVNKQCSIKRFFRRGIERQSAPHAVCGVLSMVKELNKGRTMAGDGVEPVDPATVNATLGHLNSAVTKVARLQLETGLPPGDVRVLRLCDVGVQAPFGSIDRGSTRPCTTTKTAWRSSVPQVRTSCRHSYPPLGQTQIVVPTVLSAAAPAARPYGHPTENRIQSWRLAFDLHSESPASIPP